MSTKNRKKKHINNKKITKPLTLTPSRTNTQVAGENVIGVSEGAGGGPLLLVGADYDTALNRHPLEDNGAGVGAMLEVARNYMAATGPDGVFTRNSTVIFVAFDLNTQEYVSVFVCWGRGGSVGVYVSVFVCGVGG